MPSSSEVVVFWLVRGVSPSPAARRLCRDLAGGGGSSGSAKWARIFLIGPGSVMKAIRRMSPPQFGHSSGNSSATRASSFAHTIREVSCDAVEERDPDARIDGKPAVLPGEHVGGGPCRRMPRRIPCGTSCRPRGRSRSRGCRTRDSRGVHPRRIPARAAASVAVMRKVPDERVMDRRDVAPERRDDARAIERRGASGGHAADAREEHERVVGDAEQIERRGMDRWPAGALNPKDLYS
jgi:hypothetical protein